jgi:CysZ protein
MIIGFYFYGFGFIDYVNERRRLNITQSIHFVSRHKGLAFALGSVFSICFYSFLYSWNALQTAPIDTNSQLLWGAIVIITFTLVTLAPIAAVVSSTMSIHNLVDLSKNQFAKKKGLLTAPSSENEGKKQTEEKQTETKESDERQQESSN